MKNKLANYYSSLVKFVNVLKNKFWASLAKAICKSGMHTTPKWDSRFWPACNATYYGTCRLCTKKITEEFPFSKGPVLDGIKTFKGLDGRERRDLHEIIQACVNMFIKDHPTNG